jgi:hypothetical protein
MKTLTLSFEIGEKMITLKQDLEPTEDVAAAISRILAELEAVGQPGKATVGQLRALYARATSVGWEKSRVREYLEKNVGTSVSDDIIGVADRKEFSRLISEIAPPEVPGKATAAQMRALWARALSKGWQREKVRSFLQEKVGAARDEQIIGCLDQGLVSAAIDEIAAA